MTHTPGPWTIYEPEKDITAYDKVADRTVTVAMMCDDAGLEREANADLIAAAPAMKEALLCALSDGDPEAEPLAPSVEAKIRAALAAAEGK